MCLAKTRGIVSLRKKGRLDSGRWVLAHRVIETGRDNVYETLSSLLGTQ